MLLLRGHRREARPGADKTPRWSAERRRASARRATTDFRLRLSALRSPRRCAREKREDGMPGAADIRAGGALAFCFSENPAQCDQSSFTSAALMTAAHLAISLTTSCRRYSGERR